MSQELKYLFTKLKSSNVNTQYVILKKISIIMPNATRDDLLYLLDLMNSTRGIELQVHLVSLCCVYLLSNKENVDVFISCSYIYTSMENVLSKNLPRRTSAVLYFFTLLLHEENDMHASRKLSLLTHARNMIRTSGCLATMTDFFIQGMMYQDTWKALCQCLTETCCGSEINQSYCTHLIPKCVQLCREGNMDAPPLLYSLVHNHERNIQMFIQTNGMNLFSRNVLQHCTYLQLLNTLVHTSLQARLAVQETNVFLYVQDILKSHGPYSRAGQWASVILYHADSNIKGNKQTAENTITKTANNENTSNNYVNMEVKSTCDSTMQLFHNIVNEINRCPQTKDIAQKASANAQSQILSYKQYQNTGCAQKQLFNNKLLNISSNNNNDNSVTLHSKMKRKVNRDSTISFFKIGKGNLNNRDTHNFASKETRKQINSNDSLYECNEKKYISDTSRRYDMEQHSSFPLENKFSNSSVSINNFKPGLMSTPKKNLNKSNKTSREKIRTNESNVIKNTEQRVGKLNSINKQKSRVNTSLSFRLFNAINDSYNSVVNGVKNIFNFYKNSPTSKSTISHSTRNAKREDLCNYSFTKLMLERDARLFGNRNRNNNSSNRSSDSYGTDSCKTCDDTIKLKQKIKYNIFLKRTIQKLKLGINLYGCDFKKISEVMWPKESYMTPKVLYNLYRKVILK